MYKNYTFAQNKNSRNYYCSKISNGCKAKIKLAEDGKIDFTVDIHSHEPPNYMKTSNGHYIKLS